MEDPATVRLALDALSLRLNGKETSPRTAKRKRACLSNVLGLAVEEQYFTMPANPITAVEWTAPKSVEAVDPDSVANPRQVRALLAGVREQGPRGRHLEAFFGCLCYAAMRPAEASGLRVSQCHLKKTGWGMLTLRQGVVRAGRNWNRRRNGALDAPPQGPRQEGLQAGAHPAALRPSAATAHRHARHRARWPTLPHESRWPAAGDRLWEVWAKARKDVLNKAETYSLLARRPYDLRHAGVSFWLSSGVDAMECARRAGHSIVVLHKVYAKVLDQTRERANSRIDGTSGVERAGVIKLSPWGHLGDTH